MDKRHNYPLRVDDELLAKARYVAAYDGRSLNKQIERLLVRMVKNFEAKHGEIDIGGGKPEGD